MDEKTQRDAYDKLNRRLDIYRQRIDDIMRNYNAAVAKLAADTDYDPTNGIPFAFDDFPELKHAFTRLQEDFAQDITYSIYNGCSAEWQRSEAAQDLLFQHLFKQTSVGNSGELSLMSVEHNKTALRAFLARRENGMYLSDRVWHLTDDYKGQLENAISVALQDGTSAIQLSKKLSQYLVDFHGTELQRDYTKLFGKAARIKDCEYRAARLARTEINMAYRTAEQTKWQELDFILGYEVKLSNNHNCKGVKRGEFFDVCDQLAGRYPKDFKFVGWHPNCRCFAVPITPTLDEMQAYWDADMPEGYFDEQTIKDTPDNFNEWITQNSTRISAAEQRGTLPYFLRDNDYKQYLQQPKATLDDLIAQGHITFKHSDVLEAFKGSPFADLDIAELYNDLQSSFDKYGIKMDSFNIDYVGGKLKLEAHAMQGDKDVVIRRSFKTFNDQKIATHDLFTIHENLRGKGIGKSVLSDFYKQYKKMGIDEIQLHANIDVGGYAWGRYGFSCDMFNAYDLAERFKSEQVMRIVDDFYDTHRTSAKFPVRIFCDLPNSKEALLGTSWHGFLSLHDEAQVAQFETYIGLRKKHGVTGIAGLRGSDKATKLLDTIADDYTGRTLRTPEQLQRYTEISQQLGVKLSDPMTFHDANHDRPNLCKDKENCVLSTFAYELRRKGLNVTAVACDEGKLGTILDNPETLWRTGKDKSVQPIRITTEKLKGKSVSAETISFELDKYTNVEGGRYFLYWENSGSGHIITAERINGRLVLYDAQKSLGWSIEGIVGTADFDIGLTIYRVDNLVPSETAINNLSLLVGSL